MKDILLAGGMHQWIPEKPVPPYFRFFYDPKRDSLNFVDGLSGSLVPLVRFRDGVMSFNVKTIGPEQNEPLSPPDQQLPGFDEDMCRMLRRIYDVPEQFAEMFREMLSRYSYKALSTFNAVVYRANLPIRRETGKR